MAKKVIAMILCMALLCGCSNVMWGTSGSKIDSTDTSYGGSMVYTDKKRDDYLTECYKLLTAPIYEDVNGSSGNEVHILDENGNTAEAISIEEYDRRVKEFLSTWEKTDMYYTVPYLGTEKRRYDIYYNREYDLLTGQSDMKLNYYSSMLCNDTGRIAKGWETFIEDMRSSTGFMYNDCSAGGKYTRLDFSNIEYAFLRDFPYHYNDSIEMHISHLPVRISLYFEGEKPVKAYISYMKVKGFDNKIDEETKEKLTSALEKAGLEDSALIVNEAAKTVESNEVSPSAGKYKLMHLDTTESTGYWKEDFITGKGVILAETD